MTGKNFDPYSGIYMKCQPAKLNSSEITSSPRTVAINGFTVYKTGPRTVKINGFTAFKTDSRTLKRNCFTLYKTGFHIRYN